MRGEFQPFDFDSRVRNNQRAHEAALSIAQSLEEGLIDFEDRARLLDNIGDKYNLTEAELAAMRSSMTQDAKDLAQLRIDGNQGQKR